MNEKDKNGRWKCPKCEVEAVVEGRNIHIYVARVEGHTWPKHRDCEFAVDIDHIDFSKLERVG